MKKTASSKSNRNPSPSHYHPRTQEVSGLLGFLGKILLGMLGPILDPLLCRFRGHAPEPFYKEGKYSIHTHRCSRCHRTLGIGRMNWYISLPDSESGIPLAEWIGFTNKFSRPEPPQDFTAYTPKQYEEICRQKIQDRQWLITRVKSLSRLHVEGIKP